MIAAIVLIGIYIAAWGAVAAYSLAHLCRRIRQRIKTLRARRRADQRFDSAVDWAYREHSLTGADFGVCLIAALKREYRQIPDAGEQNASTQAN